MDPANIIQLVVLIFLVILSSFFSSAETAFSTVNRIRIEALAEEGKKSAKIALKVIDNYNKMLSTILIGNNIVNLAASAIATVFATDMLGSWAIGVATGVLTVVVLLFGEIVPKTFAKLKNDKLVLIYAPFINGLCVILAPIVFIIDVLSTAILKILRIDPNMKVVGITEREFLSYVDAGHEEGVIEEEEKEMIHNLFDFSDQCAKDVMIPRPDIIEVNVDDSYEDIKNVFKDSMYTRLPVFEETPDKIIGIINIKDFLFVDDPAAFKVRDIMREAYYTYEFKKTADLLNEMREKTVTLTIVLNEYGTAEGMITLEDLLEEIVGDIKDEYDADEREAIKEVGEREFQIEGSMNLDDINDKLNISLESENYDSLGGLIIENLDDTLPEEGQDVTLLDGTRLVVESFTDNRINTVRLILPEPVEEEVEDGQAEDSNK